MATWAAFFVGCARRGGARPCAIYGSRAVCVIVVLLLCTATRALCDVHRDAGGCPVRFPSIRAGAAAAHGEVSRSASAAAGRVPRRACDWARTEMQSAAGACIAARIASLPGRGAARVRTNQKITAAR